MFYCVYVKSRPKSKWRLVSIATSSDAAAHDMEEALNKAYLSGFAEAKVAKQFFESPLWIPQYLTEIKETHFMYN